MADIKELLEILTDKITPLNRPKGEVRALMKKYLKRLGSFSDEEKRKVFCFLRANMSVG